MRDPKRIPATLEVVQTLWEQFPDWRLGQLVMNVARAMGQDDPWGVEDDKLVTAIQDMLRDS